MFLLHSCAFGSSWNLKRQSKVVLPSLCPTDMLFLSKSQAEAKNPEGLNYIAEYLGCPMEKHIEFFWNDLWNGMTASVSWIIGIWTIQRSKTWRNSVYRNWGEANCIGARHWKVRSNYLLTLKDEWLKCLSCLSPILFATPSGLCVCVQCVPWHVSSPELTILQLLLENFASQHRI